MMTACIAQACEWFCLEGGFGVCLVNIARVRDRLLLIIGGRCGLMVKSPCIIPHTVV